MQILVKKYQLFSETRLVKLAIFDTWARDVPLIDPDENCILCAPVQPVWSKVICYTIKSRILDAESYGC